MNVYSEFILTRESKMMLPIYTSYGDNYTLVLHGQKLYGVPTTQTQVMDFNLRLNHSSLRGAKDSAAYLLGSASMNPIVLCAKQQLIWFTSESLKNPPCVSIALHHIVGKPIAYSEQQTLFKLTGGWEVIIPVTFNSFKNRFQNAHLLRSYTMKTGYSDYEVEKPQQLMLLYDGHRVEYELNHQKMELPSEKLSK